MLSDDRLAVKARERFGHAASRRRGDSVGNREASAPQSCILQKLGKFEIQLRAPVEGAPPLCFQSSKDTHCYFWSTAIAEYVGGGTHPVLENALRRGLKAGKLTAT